MCGRYSLGLRPSEAQAYLNAEHMPSYIAPADDGDHAPRQTYNFAPGYNGIVYRADVPDYGASSTNDHADEVTNPTNEDTPQSSRNTGDTRYRLDSMRWGLIPSWTKRSPDFSSMIKTINCRDDSLAVNRGLWNSIKPRKRCIVICQGFYEWLKDPHNAKQKTPHYVKRKDGKLMCMAGLWDCVKYEGKEEKIYSYTVITTDSNKQLKFLHDRMPCILDNGSEEIRTWLDPGRHEWNRELQHLLRPYEGELEVYPVSKEVGRVGNNSERFIIPVDSVDNKANIANFFNGQQNHNKGGKDKVQKDEHEDRKTIDHEGTEDNAPLPVPETQGTKRQREDGEADDVYQEKGGADQTAADAVTVSHSKRLRSATSNGTTKPSPSKKSVHTPKITSFFGK